MGGDQGRVQSSTIGCSVGVSGENVDQPVHRRIRRHRAEHGGPLPQDRDVGEVVPPNATATATSPSTFPRSCTAVRFLDQASAPCRATSNPTAAAVRVTSSPPAWDTTRDAAPSTRTRLWTRVVLFT